MDPEHAVWPLLRGDDDADATHDVVLVEQRCASKALLGTQVFDDHRFIGKQGVASLRRRAETDCCLPNICWLPADTVSQQQRLARAQAVGSAIRDLPLPSECALTAIIRSGALLIPRPDLVLQPADEVLAVVHASQAPQLAALLGCPT
jgi:hypothetical protein